VVPALVVAEATYFVGGRLGARAEAAFLRGLESLDVEGPAPEDFPRIAELVETYAGFPLGGTDASVIALGERIGADIVITLDRRRFAVVKPHGPRQARLRHQQIPEDFMSHIRRFDHVGITVADLDTVTAFFVGLGLEVEGRTFVEGEFVDTVIGIPGSRSHIVMLRPPDGGPGLELSSFVQPDHEPGSPTAMANERRARRSVRLGGLAPTRASPPPRPRR
jgi:catechol 2,3-dioxygenase-like lactoylglutathione lyase family enzyme